MKHSFLLTTFILTLGVFDVALASPVCDKLKIPANQLAAFRPQGVHAQSAQDRRLLDAVTCVNANWGKLSERLTLRTTARSWFVEPTTAPVPSVVARYSPSSTYNATMATPVAFLTKPVVDVNYLPMTQLSSAQIMAHTYRLNAPHLADGVPTANYQGSLATPVIYQTGNWNQNNYGR